jgi:hypothetical protein
MKACIRKDSCDLLSGCLCLFVLILALFLTSSIALYADPPPCPDPCETPQRSSDCDRIRWGWGSCPDNPKAPCDWCYSKSGGIIAFVPRTNKTYQLSSQCEDLSGPGIQWVADNPGIIQAMKAAGGTCSPDPGMRLRPGSMICRNVNAEKYKSLTSGPNAPCGDVFSSNSEEPDAGDDDDDDTPGYVPDPGGDPNQPPDYSPPDVGGKGIKREPKIPPIPPKPNPLDPGNLVENMNDCLRRKTSYYNRPVTPQQANTGNKYAQLQNPPPVVIYDAQMLQPLDPMVRAMLLARPVAEYLLQERKADFRDEYVTRQRALSDQGPISSKMDTLEEIDSIVGFLLRCVQDRGLIPMEDPRAFYRSTFASYDGLQMNDPMWEERKEKMFIGYTSGFLPAYIAMDVP